MSMHLKESQSNTILPILVEEFDKFLETGGEQDNHAFFESLPQDAKFAPVLNRGEKQLDEDVKDLSYDMFDFPPEKSVFENLMVFLGFQSFIGRIRTEIMRINHEEEENVNVLLSKPGRIASPDKEVYRYVGWNKLDIDESKKSYSVLFQSR